MLLGKDCSGRCGPATSRGLLDCWSLANTRLMTAGRKLLQACRRRAFSLARAARCTIKTEASR